MADPPADDQLHLWRSELDELDRRLLAIAARRGEIVRRIAAAKESAAGRPLFDRQRERAVYQRAAEVAETLSLPPAVARQLMQTLIEHSHDIQENVSRVASIVQTSETESPRPRNLLIIGGAGRMGQLLAREFAARGHAVDPYDLGDPRPRDALIAQSDIILLAVPMAIAARTAAEVAPFVPEGALLADINSLKREVCQAMAAHGRGEALGLHPMFGPTVRSLRRQKVIVCPVREGPLAAWLRRELGQMGCELIDADPDTHDRMMAIVQVLVHFSTLVMGAALRESGTSVEHSLRFTSPIYRMELAFIARLFAQSPDLYAEIEMTNPHGPEARARFVAAARTLATIIDAGDREAFRTQFESIADYFRDPAGFAEEGMALSDSIIDMLVTQP